MSVHTLCGECVFLINCLIYFIYTYIYISAGIIEPFVYFYAYICISRYLLSNLLYILYVYIYIYIYIYIGRYLLSNLSISDYLLTT